MGLFPDAVLPEAPAAVAPHAPNAQFSPAWLSPQGWASYHDRFSANIGGGVYPRVMAQTGGARLYRVCKLAAAGEFATITQALAQWRADQRGAAGPRAAVIDIGDSATYHEAPRIELQQGEQLLLRAANMMRPVLRMFDYRSGVPEQVSIAGAPGSRLVLDGLMVAGGSVDIDSGGAGQERFLVTLRHCTLVPGWDPQSARAAAWCSKPSVLLKSAGIALRVDHSIVGPLRVAYGAHAELHVGDSVIDAGHEAGLAVADEGHGVAAAITSVVRSTVIGLTQVTELVLAENAIFLGPMLVVRRSLGSVRFCYLAQGSRTPRREFCQPDLAMQAGGAERVRPRHQSLRYGTPGYGQLAPDCAIEIRCGADDDGAMGVFHDQVRG
jgi:hypothetical protein